MRNRSLKSVLALSCGLLAAAAYAAPPAESSKNVAFADADHTVYSLAQGVQGPSTKIQATNLIFCPGNSHRRAARQLPVNGA